MHRYIDYQDRSVWKGKGGCPRLFLAPMEGVGDLFLRRAMASIGGMDELCTEFLRVPSNPHIRSLAAKYSPSELDVSIPLAVQVMGQEPEHMAAMAQQLWRQGAPRIDLNCGCPSNIVVGKGAGSSLLRTPDHLHRIAKSMVTAVSCPVTLKMRAGYDDTSLFVDNVLAAAESGIAFLTIHPRTKAQRYEGKADWSLIARAKELVSIPVVGNGDLLSVEDVFAMLQQTQCDGIMIGRGAVMQPWIFHHVRAAFSKQTTQPVLFYLKQFLHSYQQGLASCPVPLQINKYKQLIHYLFQPLDSLQDEKKMLLRHSFSSSEELFSDLQRILQLHYSSI